MKPETKYDDPRIPEKLKPRIQAFDGLVEDVGREYATLRAAFLKSLRRLHRQIETLNLRGTSIEWSTDDGYDIGQDIEKDYYGLLRPAHVAATRGLSRDLRKGIVYAWLTEWDDWQLRLDPIGWERDETDRYSMSVIESYAHFVLALNDKELDRFLRVAGKLPAQEIPGVIDAEFPNGSSLCHADEPTE